MEAPPTNPPPKPSAPATAATQTADNEAARPPLLSDAPAAPERPPDVDPASGTAWAGRRRDRRRDPQRQALRAADENFGNLRGGQDQTVGESIQFDSKGVEFGPWLARFVAQVRSNWMIPQAAMSMRGNVAITFIVHKDGRITDVIVAQALGVDAFTLSARNAILTSNPTIPLPPEYPDDDAVFTVTFFFNEQPPGR